MKTLSLFLLAVLVMAGAGCEEAEISDLRHNFRVYDTILHDKDFRVTDAATGKLNYIRALYSSWNSCSWDSCGFSPAYTASTLSRAFATIGDHERVLGHRSGYNSCGIDEKIKKPLPTFYPAQAYILEQFKSHRVIMFNDAPDRMQGRVFFLGMLEGLREAGATHLALEGLGSGRAGNNRSKYVSSVTEPVYAQIIRRAKELGFQLVAYGDTLAGGSGDDREKWQALNLYMKIKQGDTLAKTVVLASHAHLSEDSLPTLRMMAGYFSVIAKTDPLTVDQLSLMERSAENPEARQVLENDTVTAPVVMDRQVLQKAMGGTCSPFHFFPNDLYVYHPATEYVFRRPKWLLTEEKKLVAVKIPLEMEPVLVQAYLKPEIRSAGDYDFKVPVDQAFQVAENREVYLVLGKALDYNIVFRGRDNNILRTETISVP